MSTTSVSQQPKLLYTLKPQQKQEDLPPAEIEKLRNLCRNLTRQQYTNVSEGADLKRFPQVRYSLNRHLIEILVSPEDTMKTYILKKIENHFPTLGNLPAWRNLIAKKDPIADDNLIQEVPEDYTLYTFASRPEPEAAQKEGESVPASSLELRRTVSVPDPLYGGSDSPFKRYRKAFDKKELDKKA